MKKDLHPSNYREVVFKDMSNDEIFITRSTVAAKETIEVDGVTYPLVKLEITSASHPFFTGKQKLVDTAGRVDKFMTATATVQPRNNSFKRISPISAAAISMAARAIFKRSDYTAKAYKATAPKNVVCHKPLRYCVKAIF